jgi:hypothetical protein
MNRAFQIDPYGLKNKHIEKVPSNWPCHRTNLWVRQFSLTTAHYYGG